QAAAARDVARADRDRLAADLARVRPLVASDALPRSQLEGLEASLRAADARVAQLAAGQRAASVRRGRTVVRAPTEGVIVGLEAEIGDLVAPQVPVAQVVRMERVEVALRVVEEDFVRLETGLQAQIAPPSMPGFSRTGTLVRLSPVLDRLTRTGEVVVQVENADGRLRPGMVTEVGIELERREDVLLVPSRALLLTTRTDEDGLARLFVVADGRAERRDVRLGKRYAAAGEQRVEIVQGIDAGAAVVVRGQTLLRDGARVRAQLEEGSEPVAAAETTSPARASEGRTRP
ncbi:MAG: efflux RND transporter periplasmic adaptor subunit, partial [Myxococcota bacterium]